MLGKINLVGISVTFKMFLEYVYVAKVKTFESFIYTWHVDVTMRLKCFSCVRAL